MKKIIQDARELLTPSEDMRYEKNRVAEISLNRVKEEVEKYEEIVGVEIGGSYAKDTWLETEMDIDIFVKFKDTTPKEEFVNISQKVGFDAMKEYQPYTRYSEHPYVEAKINQTKINIVPCYNVNLGEWKSSADRSPYHTKNMVESLTTEMKKDVRLLKKFLQSAGIYGAEIAKQGFSGYASEVLVLNFKSFENVVNAMTDLKKNDIVGETDEEFHTPIVIIDPIDSKRNLAAAISKENVGKFILRCRAFQKNPKIQFFEQNKQFKVDVDPQNILVVSFKFKTRSPETIWGQSKKASASLRTKLNLEGYNVLRNGAFVNENGEGWLFFLLESIRISSMYVRVGPEFFSRNYVESFIEKNSQKSKLMWVGSGGKITTLESRKFNDAVSFLDELLKNGQAKLPKGLEEDFKDGFEVFAGIDELNESVKDTISDLVSTDDTFLYFN